jgi:hypothetical protein
MVEPLELWQRLGHASYRDWVLAAQRARRVTIAAKKAAAKATTLLRSVLQCTLISPLADSGPCLP